MRHGEVQERWIEQRTVMPSPRPGASRTHIEIERCGPPSRRPAIAIALVLWGLASVLISVLVGADAGYGDAARQISGAVWGAAWLVISAVSSIAGLVLWGCGRN